MPQSSLTAWLQRSAAASQKTQAANTTSTPEDEAGTEEAKTLSIDPAKEPLPSQVKPIANYGSEIGKRTTILKPWTAPPPHLPPNVEIRPCTKADIPAFKRLNSVLLPLPYPDSFYTAIVSDSAASHLTLLAVWHDDPANIGKEKGRLIGAIRCRLLPEIVCSPKSGKEAGKKDMLYLSTLALLSPYRGHGIAAHMLHTLTTRAIAAYCITSVGAHVWVANEEGLEWYTKRGFKVVGKEANYYRKLDPSGAVVVQREVKVSDLLGE